VLADGVTGGRRIFANTIKYVLMGTSSDLGRHLRLHAVGIPRRADPVRDRLVRKVARHPDPLTSHDRTLVPSWQPGIDMK